MTRILSSMRWEIRLQFRHGFYYAAGFVAMLAILVLRQLPPELMAQALPVFVMGNMTLNTFYFMAALVLLEKDDGVLEGLVVTPLRRGEYLWTKLLTLIFLTVLENGIIVTAVVGLTYNPFWLLLGIGLMGFFYALYGFVIVARYDSINSFIFPSIFWTLPLSLPLLQYLGLVQAPWMALHPMNASLQLLAGAFRPTTPAQAALDIGYGLLWLILIYQVALRAFDRFIVLKRGVKV